MMIMSYDEYEQERKEDNDKIHRLEKTSLRCLTDYKFLKKVMMGRNNTHAANVFWCMVLQKLLGKTHKIKIPKKKKKKKEKKIGLEVPAIEIARIIFFSFF